MLTHAVLRAQALLMQMAGLFTPGSHCIADHMVTVRITGTPQCC